MMRNRKNRIVLWGLTLYLIILHVLLIVAVWRPYLIWEALSHVGRQPPEVSTHYRRMLAYHLRGDDNIPSGAVLFIGDSITQGLCTVCVTGLGINYGIGGDTTVGVLLRINRYTSLSRAKAVVLAVGINDMARRSNAAILDNYEKILMAIPRETTIIFSSVLPVDSRKFTAEANINQRISALNNAAKIICQKHPNCFYSSSNKELAGTEGDLKAPYHVGDGVHLNSVGYNIWIRILQQGLALAGIQPLVNIPPK